MAVFGHLGEVHAVFAKLVADATALTETDVLVGPPHAEPTAPESIRVTVMWVNADPTHRNDPWERRADGALAPPPLTVSIFYLVTYYGDDQGAGGWLRPHELMSGVLRRFHSSATVALPLSADARGEGKVEVTLVPMTPELMEKLFSPHQTKHRPFNLFEVGPVQLTHLEPVRRNVPLVMPGGVRLRGPGVVARPRVDQVVPHAQAEGGRLRIDGRFEAGPQVTLGGVPLIVEAEPVPGETIFVRLPALPLADAVEPGVQPLLVSVDGVPGEPVPVQVLPALQLSLDAPQVLSHPSSAPLTITGRGLGAVVDVYAWRESGVRNPLTDIVELAVTSVSPSSFTLPASELQRIEGDVWRLAARTDSFTFSPYVVLEVRP